MARRVMCFILCAALIPAAFLFMRPKAPAVPDAAYIDAAGNAYLVCHGESQILIWKYLPDGTDSGLWILPRYDGYDYFSAGNLAFDGSRVFLNLMRADSRDYIMSSQTWLEFDFDKSTETELYEVSYTERFVPLGSSLYFTDGTLLSVDYYPGELIYHNVTEGTSKSIHINYARYPSTAIILSPESILTSDILGGLWLVTPDGAIEQIREYGATITSLKSDAEGNIYYCELDGHWMKNAPEMPEAFVDSELPPDTSLEFIYDELSYIASENEGFVYHRAGEAMPLTVPVQFSVKWFMISIAAGIVFGAVCTALIWYMGKRRVSILLKLTASLVIVLAAGAILLVYGLGKTFAENHERAKITEALLSANAMAAQIDIDRLLQIDWSAPTESDYFDELYRLLQYRTTSVNVKRLLPDGKNENTQVMVNAYYILLAADEEGLKIGICDERFSNVPVNPNIRIGIEYLALYEDPSLPPPLSGFEDKGSEWLSVAVPVLTSDKKTAAIIEAGFSKRQYIYETNLIMREIVFQICAIIGLAALLLSVYLKMMLSSVKELRGAVEAAGKGDYSVSVPVSGRDEIAEISAAFNKMAAQIDEYTRGLQELNLAYMRFFPKDVFNTLGQDSVLSVKRGQYKCIEANILHVHILRLDKATLHMDQESIFSYVNKISQEVIGTALSKNGVVESYRQSEYICLFENADDALEAAVKLSRALLELSPPPEITQSLVRGEALLGVAGHDRRLGTMMLSGALSLSRRLGQLGDSCGARILYTGDIELTRPYYRRKMSGIAADDKILSVFECFEGDESCSYAAKREKIELFERGVQLFEEEEWIKSRSVFIQYIKEAAPDAAAKYFLFLCDERAGETL